MDIVESYKQDLRLIRKPWTGVWVLSIIGAVVFLPFYASEHLVYTATIIAIYAIGVCGQNLLIGYTGQISFGQAGFLCIGAFSFGHLSAAGFPIIAGIFTAGLITGFFGLLVGFPSLRLKGPYLAIVTMGFGIAVYQIFVNWPLISGGRMGMTITGLSPLPGISLVNFYFYFNLIISLGFILLTYNIVSSYMGRAFIAIRDNDIAAQVLGVNLTVYKLLSFAISSFYLGVQAALYAMTLGFIEPNMFTFMQTITFLVAVIVGGMGYIEGSIMGAAFVILIPHFCSELQELVPVIFGAAVILILIFEPAGLAGRWLKIRLYFRNWPFR